MNPEDAIKEAEYQVELSNRMDSFGVVARALDNLLQVTKMYKESIDSQKELVRELDVLINGDNAAEQASLCDLVAQIKEQGFNHKTQVGWYKFYDNKPHHAFVEKNSFHEDDALYMGWRRIYV